MAKSEIKFKYNEDKTAIDAIYSLTRVNPISIDSFWINQKLKEQGMDHCAVIEKGVLELVETVNKSNFGSGKIRIAELKDAEIIIDVHGDTEAFLTIHPPRGGRAASLEMVKKVLAVKGIRHGFLLDAIRLAIITGEADKLLIAKSDPVVDGENTKFVCLLPEIKIRTPRISKRGNVDYRDLGDVTVVEPGQALMRRIRATRGTNTKNIFGEQVSARPGKEAHFASGLKGVKQSETDPDVLVATEAGQPIIVENGVIVENTMSLKQVDLSSGNVTFDGSVIIGGDVARNAKVVASGDITVKGTVESATLNAGGDIIIRGVIVGHEDKLSKKIDSANIKAEGSISAKGIEYANLEAGSNVYVEDWVINSNVNAVNEVIVGNSSARKGQIIGGKVASGILVKAIKFGSNAGVETLIEVGNTDSVNQRLEAVNSQIAKQESLLKDLHKKIFSLKKSPTKHGQELLKETVSSYAYLKNSLVELREQKSKLIVERDRWKNARVISDKTIYSGVSISVAGLEKHFKDDVGKRTLQLKDGKLVSLFDLS